MATVERFTSSAPLSRRTLGATDTTVTWEELRAALDSSGAAAGVLFGGGLAGPGGTGTGGAGG